MKKFYSIFILILLTGTALQAQSRLEMHNPTLNINNDTIRIGDSITFVYSLYNTGNVQYSDSINTYLATNLDSNPLVYTIKNVVIDTLIQDSFTVVAKFPIQPPHFQENVKSIIVIWPTGTGTTIKADTFISKEIEVKTNVSISEQKNKLNYVRFYPNPTQDILHFEMLKPEAQVHKIILRDIQGRTIKYFDIDLGRNAIDLGDQKAGIYFMDILFSDNKTAKYRVIKTE